MPLVYIPACANPWKPNDVRHAYYLPCVEYTSCSKCDGIKVRREPSISKMLLCDPPIAKVSVKQQLKNWTNCRERPDRDFEVQNASGIRHVNLRERFTSYSMLPPEVAKLTVENSEHWYWVPKSPGVITGWEMLHLLESKGERKKWALDRLECNRNIAPRLRRLQREMGTS